MLDSGLNNALRSITLVTESLRCRGHKSERPIPLSLIADALTIKISFNRLQKQAIQEQTGDPIPKCHSKDYISSRCTSGHLLIDLHSQ